MMKKGQAVTEYLSTYGFMFLAVLIGLGVLSYAGLLDVDRLRPQACELSFDVTCLDFVLVDNSLNLSIRNDFPVPIITVSDIQVFVQGESVTPICNSLNLAPAQTGILSCALNMPQYRTNQRYRLEVGIPFTQQNSPNQHVITGHIHLLSQ